MQGGIRANKINTPAKPLKPFIIESPRLIQKKAAPLDLAFKMPLLWAMAKKNEAHVRLKIDELLKAAGWRLIDGPEGKANVQVEQPTQSTTQPRRSNKEMVSTQAHSNSPTNNTTSARYNEHPTRGYIDYLLLDSKGYPLAVLEAKHEGKNPLDAKDQARRYARQQGVRFVILSNGSSHYFWDLEASNPELYLRLPTQKALQHKLDYKTHPKQFCREVVDEDYIAREQKPDIVQHPHWPTRKHELAEQHDIKILRPYQLKAIQALQQAVQHNEHQRRFLFEMATGTGKTLLTAAVIKLFLRTENASRVLFLVDRVELENQARKSFKCLEQSYQCGIYKQHRNDWHKFHIIVSTVQSLIDVYSEKFEPNDFDLLISDEAHRSIGGKSRAIFEYFEGFKLGLSATPRDYLKNIDVDKLADSHPKKLERRLLLDTYKTFGCADGAPTFKYDLLQGVQDNFLISPTVVDARTRITAQLLSNEGYTIDATDDNDATAAYPFAGSLSSHDKLRQSAANPPPPPPPRLD